MVQITIDMLKELREKTATTLTEARQALTEAAGDIARAEEVLRAKSRLREREGRTGGIEDTSTSTTVHELIADALKDKEFASHYAKHTLEHALSGALFRLRKASGLTQTALARLHGWHQPYVARLEANPPTTTMERVEKFANACGASAILLFVEDRTGVIRESVPLGNDERIQRASSRMVGSKVSMDDEPAAFESASIPDLVEEVSIAIDDAAQRLRSLSSKFEVMQHQIDN